MPMVTEIKIDGKYRPEEWCNGVIWHAVAYIPFRGSVNRVVSSEAMRGETYPLSFNEITECQKVCDQLNNAGPENLG